MLTAPQHRERTGGARRQRPPGAGGGAGGGQRAEVGRRFAPEQPDGHGHDGQGQQGADDGAPVRRAASSSWAERDSTVKPARAAAWRAALTCAGVKGVADSTSHPAGAVTQPCSMACSVISDRGADV